MVLLLVGMQHYLNKYRRHNEMDDTNNDLFRRMIKEDDVVMSDFNLFSRFISDNKSPERITSLPRILQRRESKRATSEIESIQSPNHSSHNI